MHRRLSPPCCESRDPVVTLQELASPRRRTSASIQSPSFRGASCWKQHWLVDRGTMRASPGRKRGAQPDGVYSLRYGATGEERQCDGVGADTDPPPKNRRALVCAWRMLSDTMRIPAVTILEQMDEWLAPAKEMRPVPAATRQRLAIHVLDTVAAWIAGRTTEEGVMLARLKSVPRASLPVLTDHALDRIALACATTRLTEVDDIHMPSCVTAQLGGIAGGACFCHRPIAAARSPNIRRSVAGRL